MSPAPEADDKLRLAIAEYLEAAGPSRTLEAREQALVGLCETFAVIIAEQAAEATGEAFPYAPAGAADPLIDGVQYCFLTAIDTRDDRHGKVPHRAPWGVAYDHAQGA